MQFRRRAVRVLTALFCVLLSLTLSSCESILLNADVEYSTTAYETPDYVDPGEEELDDDSMKKVIEEGEKKRYEIEGTDAFYLLPSGTGHPAGVQNFQMLQVENETEVIYGYQILYYMDDPEGLGGVKEEGYAVNNSPNVVYETGSEKRPYERVTQLVTIVMEYHVDSTYYKVLYHHVETIQCLYTTNASTGDETLHLAFHRTVQSSSSSSHTGYANESDEDLLLLYMQPLADGAWMFFHNGCAYFFDKDRNLTDSLDTNQRLELLTADFGGDAVVRIASVAADDQHFLYVVSSVYSPSQEDAREEEDTSYDDEEDDEDEEDDDDDEEKEEEYDREYEEELHRLDNTCVLMRFFPLQLNAELGEGGELTGDVFLSENGNYQKQIADWKKEAVLDFGTRDGAPDEEEIKARMAAQGLDLESILKRYPDLDDPYTLTKDGIRFDLYAVRYEDIPIPSVYKMPDDDSQLIENSIRNYWKPVGRSSGSEPDAFASAWLLLNATQVKSQTGAASNRMIYMKPGVKPLAITGEKVIAEKKVTVTWEEEVEDEASDSGTGGDSDTGEDSGTGGGSASGGGTHTEQRTQTYTMQEAFTRNWQLGFPKGTEIMWETGSKSPYLISQAPGNGIILYMESSNPERTGYVWDIGYSAADGSLWQGNSSADKGMSLKTGGAARSHFLIVPDGSTGSGDALLISTDTMVTLTTEFAVRGRSTEDPSLQVAAPTGYFKDYVVANYDLNFPQASNDFNLLRRYQTTTLTSAGEDTEDTLPDDYGMAGSLVLERNGTTYLYLAAGATGVVQVNLSRGLQYAGETSKTSYTEHSYMDFTGSRSWTDEVRLSSCGIYALLTDYAVYGIWPSKDPDALIAIGFPLASAGYTENDLPRAKIFKLPLRDVDACNCLFKSAANKYNKVIDQMVDLTGEEKRKLWSQIMTNLGITADDPGYRDISYYPVLLLEGDVSIRRAYKNFVDLMGLTEVQDRDLRAQYFGEIVTALSKCATTVDVEELFLKYLPADRYNEIRRNVSDEEGDPSAEGAEQIKYQKFLSSMIREMRYTGIDKDTTLTSQEADDRFNNTLASILMDIDPPLDAVSYQDTTYAKLFAQMANVTMTKTVLNTLQQKKYETISDLQDYMMSFYMTADDIKAYHSGESAITTAGNYERKLQDLKDAWIKVAVEETEEGSSVPVSKRLGTEWNDNWQALWESNLKDIVRRFTE